MWLFFQAAPTPVVWYEDPITVATIVIAVCTLFYSVFTFLILKATAHSARITSEIFEAAHRPYIGISEMVRKVDHDNDMMQFTFTLTNSGSVPASDLKVTLQALHDGIAFDIRTFEKNIACVMPQGCAMNYTRFEGEQFTMAQHASALTFRFSIQYQGIRQKQYSYEAETIYYRGNDIFITTEMKYT